MAKLITLASCAVFLLGACSGKESSREAALKTFEAWPAPIEVRVYQGAFSREPEQREIKLAGLAGEVLSAQVVVKASEDIEGLKGTLFGPDGQVLSQSLGRVRFGAFIPVDETMALTADPLLEEETVDLPANVAQSVWLTLHLPADVPPGTYDGKLELSASSCEAVDFRITVEVLPARLPEPRYWSYYLNIWQDPTAVARAYKVKVWSEEHWQILERYAANYAAHGMKSIMTHIVYDPWDGVRGYASDAMVEWKYPGVFKKGGADRFEWDFTAFDRYVELMMKAGVKDKIDCYALVMGPGSTTNANIRYLDTSAGEYRTAELEVGEPMWREAWAAFLPVLREHLKEKGWFEKALLGFDEKPEKVMKIIFDFIIETAPDFKLASSGGYPGDERKWGDEVVIHIDEMTDRGRWAQVEPLVKRMHADKSRYVSFYTACMPHFPNTFIFSPLRESRLMAWLAWKYGFDGYTRWAVDLFPEDIWNQPLFTWPSGDMFFVYPGEEGPLDSMRWELMRQGIQDYEALRMAWEMAQKAGRKDLLEKLGKAVRRATIIDSCGWIPYIEEARGLVNEVIRELGPGAV
ncbi:MAG TPA: DUF4091 domain-containing protein [archaeon]|nr:DUF4091 domain-containing protein [archaeon]